MTYSSRLLPRIRSFEDLEVFLGDELLEITKAFGAVENVRLARQHVAPAKVEDGQLARADGTDWDPGDGAGVYYWDGDESAWVFLGGPTP